LTFVVLFYEMIGISWYTDEFLNRIVAMNNK